MGQLSGLLMTYAKNTPDFFNFRIENSPFLSVAIFLCVSKFLPTNCMCALRKQHPCRFFMRDMCIHVDIATLLHVLHTNCVCPS